ncbi:MAG TPA: gluconate:H+ symporter [Symbiobacteriaceae bacterium]|nr:gluconate:H+ symporter [Symbiobacteriaceae bacterium]
MNLLVVAALGVLALVLLVMWGKVSAFLSLLLVSIAVGVASGMPLSGIMGSIEKGMGGTLGFIATVIGLGALIGEILERSGGAQQLAMTMVRKFGDENASWAVGLVAFIFGLAIFFDVGFIVLIPLVHSIALRTKKSTLFYAIPLLASLAVTHAFIPPHPGPVAVADVLGASMGQVMMYGFLAGLPTAIIAGPIFGRFIGKKFFLKVPDWVKEDGAEMDESKLPNFWLVLSVILLPIVLILFGAYANMVAKHLTAAKQAVPYGWQFVQLIGHPFAALICGIILSFITLGFARGLTKQDLLKLSNKALGPTGGMILVIGAGGVFKQILVDSKIGDMLAKSLGTLGWSPLVLAFVMAALIRIAQGSATVAMMTTAGFIAPVLKAFPGTSPGWTVIAIAAGATILSHVNDAGFWLVKQYLDTDEATTFKTWTVMETLIALVGFGFVLLFSSFI